jgi:hypothetical protein
MVPGSLASRPIDRHEDMRRSPLVALVLSFSFALQLLLARDGTTCVGAGGDHHGMDMAASAAPSVDMSGMDMPSDASEHEAPHGSCDHESAGTACLVMAPCASGFVSIAANVDDNAGTIPGRVAISEVVMPASRTHPPELPPPRA